VLTEVEKYTWDYSKLLRKYNRTQTLSQLAGHLNSMGFSHVNGAPFHGGVSTGRYLHDLYWKIEPFLGAEAAKPVAEAFTGADGGYCYDNDKKAA
jgi:hypothetical protein